jgi:hypothetical protein
MSFPLRAKTSDGVGEVDIDRSSETNALRLLNNPGFFSNALPGRGEEVIGGIEGGGGVEPFYVISPMTRRSFREWNQRD